MVQVSGLMVVSELACDGCGRVMKHAARYGLVREEGKPPRRLCEDCSRKKGYLKQVRDEKGNLVETFLSG